MTVIVERSPDHTTSTSGRACYCTLIDSISGEIVGQFEVLFLAGGIQRYRSLSGIPYPTGLDLMGATRHAIAERAREQSPVAA